MGSIYVNHHATSTVGGAHEMDVQVVWKPRVFRVALNLLQHVHAHRNAISSAHSTYASTDIAAFGVSRVRTGVTQKRDRRSTRELLCTDEASDTAVDQGQDLT